MIIALRTLAAPQAGAPCAVGTFASFIAVAMRGLTRSERPRPHRREAAFYERDELVRLFAAMRSEPQLRRLCQIAYGTGCRLGELAGLTWADIDMSDAVLHVRRTYSDGRLGSPKSGQRRDVDLTGDMVQLLAEQWADLGKPGDDVLVFPWPSATGYLSQRSVASGLYAAMRRAGVSRQGGNGERRSFHSFRHSHVATCLASGMSLYVVSQRMGHSAIATTTSLYGHLAVDERKRQARLLEGAFSV